MKSDIFQSFPDRQITEEITGNRGKYGVLRSRDTGHHEVLELENDNCYMEDTENPAVARLINRESVVMLYDLWAGFLPKNTITDGSVALLTLQNGSRLPTEKDLAYYGSKELEHFYRVACNYETCPLNIDTNSVFFLGLLKEV